MRSARSLSYGCGHPQRQCVFFLNQWALYKMYISDVRFSDGRWPSRLSVSPSDPSYAHMFLSFWFWAGAHALIVVINSAACFVCVVWFLSDSPAESSHEHRKAKNIEGKFCERTRRISIPIPPVPFRVLCNCALAKRSSHTITFISGGAGRSSMARSVHSTEWAEHVSVCVCSRGVCGFRPPGAIGVSFRCRVMVFVTNAQMISSIRFALVFVCVCLCAVFVCLVCEHMYHSDDILRACALFPNGDVGACRRERQNHPNWNNNFEFGHKRYTTNRVAKSRAVWAEWEWCAHVSVRKWFDDFMLFCMCVCAFISCGPCGLINAFDGAFLLLWFG